MRAEIETIVDEIQAGHKPAEEASLTGITPSNASTELNPKAEDPSTLERPEEGQKLMRERQRLEESIAAINGLEQTLADNVDLIEHGRGGGRRRRSSRRPKRRSAGLRSDAQKRQVETLLSGEADANDSYLEVHAGAGGTESQDWAAMLLRMYMRWAERAQVQGRGARRACRRRGGHQVGDAADQGPQRLWLAEDGNRRPPPRADFALSTANARRHTTFASVWVYPVVDDTIDIEVNESDCRIDTYRSSGAGGQHVNTTDSAVRITHMPTGIVVPCQNERSQHKNRATAWNMLRARLYEAELEEARGGGQRRGRLEDRDRLGPPDPLLRPAALSDGEGPADRGSRAPRPHEVLDGDLDEFMEAALAQRVHGGEANVEDID